MKKFGFTLAEVLITLTIVGVIAALVTSAIIDKSTKAKIGPSLAKFDNVFSNAVQQYLIGQEINMFDKDKLSADMAGLAEIIKMTPISSYSFTKGDGATTETINSDPEIAGKYNAICQCLKLHDCDIQYDINGDETVNYDDLNIAKENATNMIYQLTNSGIMAVVPVTTYTALDNKGAYKGVIAEVIYDIDGDKGKNKAGKDVFGFLLDASGILVPASSSAHKYIGQNGVSYVTSYTDTCSASSSTLNENLACTGKIADNGWKIKGIDLD